MRRPDPERVADLLREVAAEEIVARFRDLDADEVREKAPGDLVTVVDLAVERRLGAALAEILPGARVLGEEAVASDSARLRWLEEAGAVWVIDPLDGTANFAAGRPHIALILALVVDGRTESGWILDPLTGRLAMAGRGEGATLDGEPVRLVRTADGPERAGAVYGRVLRQSPGYEALYRGASPGPLGRLANRRSVGQEYLARLGGELDYGVYTRLNPWDHAAGCLIHQEAGGHVALFDRSPYRPAVPPGLGAVVAPDAASWDEIHAALVAPVLATN